MVALGLYGFIDSECKDIRHRMCRRFHDISAYSRPGMRFILAGFISHNYLMKMLALTDIIGGFVGTPFF